MDKQEVERKKGNKLFIIGSASGINRFYVTNKFIESYPSAKVISTGVLINALAKGLNLGNFDNMPLSAYHKYLEPMFIETILNHLEHGDVILDTHFYHDVPCISIRGLRKFIGKISEAIIVLTEEDNAERIFNQKRNRGNAWFDSLENIEEDMIANKIYFKLYIEFFSTFVKQKSISINLEKEEISVIDKFIGSLKNE